ncbi:MAG TPA: PAS domain S-box protein, partial [Dongiaceae bacterium]|nr:PAS domain S-box protein [Dongiaceae bacterium]
APTTGNGLSNDYLAVAVGATTALLLVLALIAAFMDRRFAQAQREARIVEANEARYRRIFDTAAVSIWDEDFSAVIAALEALRARGVRDFARYFDEHPEFVAEAAGLVRVRDVNRATLELFEAQDKAELLGALDRVFLPETLAVFRDELLAIAAGAPSFRGTAPAQTLGGRRIETLLSMVFPWDDQRLSSVLVSLLDVTERKRAVDALQVSQAQKSAVIELSLDGVIVIDEQGGILEFNPAAERMFGIRRPDALGREMAELVMPARFRDQHRSGMKRYLASGRHEILGQRLEMTALRADGSEFPIELAINATDVNGRPIFTGFLRDVTAEREAEAQLRQAQKMESVGQLTGGVAHDFNNLLTVVIGSLDLALGRVQGDVQSVLESALQAAERGAALVQRLLAFSRRQTLIPEALDLNRLAAEMEDLLRRTLGEDIEIELKLNAPLWTALADKGQVENALLNLTVNARDAMPAGGKLTIETGNVHLDEDYAAQSPEVTPGDYVMLAVTDTGSGMPAEVLEHAFEPFFTTKDVGKGSGLGLSMIYGFAKQSGGHVKVYSEVGHGTTVRLYLPRQSAAVAGVAHAPATQHDLQRGGEMILVVEDNADVRAFVVKHLHELGYRVIEAKDGPSALQILEQSTPIDLLLTDVVMPGGMTGRQLSDHARRRRPDLKTLFISGYTEDSIVHQGKLDPGVNFLSKPFRRRDLALKVREALEAQGAVL